MLNIRFCSSRTVQEDLVVMPLDCVTTNRDHALSEHQAVVLKNDQITTRRLKGDDLNLKLLTLPNGGLH